MISGVYELHLTRGLGGMAMDIDKVPGDWVTTDYRLGDALIFHSLTVHKALPNQSPDRFRLSVDYRFSPASQPIVEKELVPTYNLISWEDVYAGWESKDGAILLERVRPGRGPVRLEARRDRTRGGVRGRATRGRYGAKCLSTDHFSPPRRGEATGGGGSSTSARCANDETRGRLEP